MAVLGFKNWRAGVNVNIDNLAPPPHRNTTELPKKMYVNHAVPDECAIFDLA